MVKTKACVGRYRSQWTSQTKGLSAGNALAHRRVSAGELISTRSGCVRVCGRAREREPVPTRRKSLCSGVALTQFVAQRPTSQSHQRQLNPAVGAAPVLSQRRLVAVYTRPHLLPRQQQQPLILLLNNSPSR